MPTMGEKLWEIGKSPPQNLTLLIFGLFALLAGVILRSFAVYIGSTAAVTFVAAALGGIGAFFVAVALFLGAFAGLGESNGTGLRIAALIGAVVVVIILL
jgi:FtsH-binding integral membrane protein